MGAEEALATAVLEWGEKQVPGRRAVIDEAAEVAVRRYREGATVDDACEEAKQLVDEPDIRWSWRTSGAVTDWEMAS